jgi:ParB family chromosome partitioning protein
MLRIAPPTPKPGESLAGDIAALADLMKHYSWTDIEKLRGNANILERIEEAEGLLASLRKALLS